MGFKISYLFIYLFLLLLCFHSVYPYPRTISIGGLFDSEWEDQELVFGYAVDSINNRRQFSQFQLSAEHERVSPEDSYEVKEKLCSLLKKGVGGIFGPSSRDTSYYVHSTCDSMEIPQLETRRDPHPMKCSSVLNLYPYAPFLARVYVDIVMAYHWKSFTILYENDFGLHRINELLKMYDPKGYTVTMRRLDILDGNNYRPILTRVKRSGEHYFILECSQENLYEIMKQLQQVGLMSDHHHYIITTLDIHSVNLDEFQYGGANITGVRIVDPEDPDVIKATKMWKEQYSRTHKKIDMEEWMRLQNVLVETALMYDAVHIFALAVKELNMTRKITPRSLDCDGNESWEHGYSLVNYMKTVTHKGLTGLIKFDNEGFRSDFQLDIVELMNDGLIKIGTWNSTDGLNITRKEKNGLSNRDDGILQNKTFIVLTALANPYGMLKESANKLQGNDRFEGFGIDLIHEMSLMLGFNYTFILQHDKNYGSLNKETGEWNGMIKELREGRADLAITDLTITSERESGVDFTNPFMNLGISILFKKPQKARPKLFSFMAPFSGTVWLYLGMAYIGVSFLLFVMGRLSPNEWTNPFPCIEEPENLYNQFTIKNSLWFTVGSLLQQGSEIAPIANSTRLVAGCWWFFTLIMVSSYTANLAAFLTVESTVTIIKSAEDLVNHNTIQYGAKKGGSTAGFFRDSNISTFRRMGEYMAAHPEVMTDSNEQGLLRVQTSDYAYLMESTSIEYIVQRYCDLNQVGGLLDTKGYGIAMKKDSSYRNALSTAILKLQESGQLEQLKIKWWKEQRGGGACSDSESSEAKKLEFQNLSGVFLVMAVGVITSLLMSFGEMIIGSWSRSIKHKLPFCELLSEEFKFFMKCSGLTKPVRTCSKEVIDEDISHKSEEEYIGQDYNGFQRYGFIPNLQKKSSVD